MAPPATDFEERLARAGARWHNARDEQRDAAAERDALVVQAIDRGMSLRQIAGLLGITHGAVQQIADRRSQVPRRIKALPTLHDAMVEALEDHLDGLTPEELADRVQARGTWRRPSDGAPAGPGQVAARADNYPLLFDVREGRIRLR
jgi:transcriptional regulator with XRE-family HTH domain